MKRPAALGRAAVCVAGVGAGLSVSAVGCEGGGGGAAAEEEAGGSGREGACGVCCARVPTTRVGPSVGTGASVRSLLKLLVWRTRGLERVLAGRVVSVAAGTQEEERER